MRLMKLVAWSVVALGVAGGAAWFVWPKPVPVDLATITRGPMAVAIDDEARTSLRHIYTVSSPVAGVLLRISNPADEVTLPSLHVGDQVRAGDTVAVLQPVAPILLDVRSRRELEAAASAAAAAVTLASAEVERIRAVLSFSQEELVRAEGLAATNTISRKQLEAAQTEVAVNEAALQSAEAQLQVRLSERDAVVARLSDTAGESLGAGDAGCCVEVRAPADGVVLRVVQQSEGTIAAGAPLLEIGDPADLEIVAELLSTDAVQIAPGGSVSIDSWGGEPLAGSVTRIDPDGFVKVSALGIEEMRVRTIIDILDPRERWSTLGNNFRVVVHIDVWRTDEATTVPVAALFRDGDAWAAFAVRDGVARTAPVEIGHRNDRVAEVLAGLAPGDQVVLHPSDRIADGTAVSQRATVKR